MDCGDYILEGLWQLQDPEYYHHLRKLVAPWTALRIRELLDQLTIMGVLTKSQPRPTMTEKVLSVAKDTQADRLGRYQVVYHELFQTVAASRMVLLN